MKHKPTRSTPQLPTSYSRAAVVFVCLALLSAVFVAYLSLSRTIITVTPKFQSQTIRFGLVVREATEPEPTDRDTAGAITGRLLSTTVSESDRFEVEGSGESVPAPATGQVTIHNKWNQVQPLAATTRFLSESGVLFRLKERVDVPPGGQAAADVYADQPGEAGNIDPSHFTLPGLWPGLQSKIYAESAEAMTGGLKNLKVVTESDLSQAIATLQSTLLDRAKSEFSQRLSGSDASLSFAESTITPTVTKQSHSVEVGTETDSFESTLTLKVTAVALAPEVLNQAVQNRLASSLPKYFRFITMNAADLAVSIDRINEDSRTAELTVESDVTTAITLDHPMFNQDTLTNKDRQSIRDYFADFPEVQDIEVRFSPFWTFRSSNLPDHIEVRLAKPS